MYLIWAPKMDLVPVPVRSPRSTPFSMISDSNRKYCFSSCSVLMATRKVKWGKWQDKVAEFSASHSPRNSRLNMQWNYSHSVDVPGKGKSKSSLPLGVKKKICLKIQTLFPPFSTRNRFTADALNHVRLTQMSEFMKEPGKFGMVVAATAKELGIGKDGMVLLYFNSLAHNLYFRWYPVADWRRFEVFSCCDESTERWPHKPPQLRHNGPSHLGVHTIKV